MSEMIRATKWDALAGNMPVGTQDLKHPYIRLSADLIDEEVNGKNELLWSYYEGDVLGLVDGIGDTLKVVCQMCFALGVNPEAVLKAVNDSNYSKFCTSEEDAIQSVMKYSDDTRYKNVFYEHVGDYFVIKGWKVEQNVNADMPKILKGVRYHEPYLHHLVGVSDCSGRA